MPFSLFKPAFPKLSCPRNLLKNMYDIMWK